MSSNIRAASRAAAVILVAVAVAGCLPVLPWVAGQAPGPTQLPVVTPAPTPTPEPTPSPTPVSPVDGFRAYVLARDFQAQGPVTGTVVAHTILGSRTGTITGTFKVKGADSAYSITSKLLGVTEAGDYVVVAGSAYTRSNGGPWSRSAATGQTIPILVAGLILVDSGVEVKFGRSLHHLTVADGSAVDLTALGIAPGSRQNLAATVSFWAEADGTPAGVTIDASFDQSILGTPSHETVAIDIAIESLSGVEIAAPI